MYFSSFYYRMLLDMEIWQFKGIVQSRECKRDNQKVDTRRYFGNDKYYDKKEARTLFPIWRSITCTFFLLSDIKDSKETSSRSFSGRETDWSPISSCFFFFFSDWTLLLYRPEYCSVMGINEINVIGKHTMPFLTRDVCMHRKLRACVH